MFEVYSWSYRFVYIFLIGFFSLFSYLAYFKDKTFMKIMLPVINIILITSTFALISYYFEPFDYNALYVAGGLIVMYIISRIALKALFKVQSLILIDLVYFLLTIGLSMQYRLSPDYGSKQIIYLVVALVAFFVAFAFMKKFQVKPQYSVLFGLVILFFLVLTQIFGQQINGSKNWIKISTMAFQPSEILKLVFVYFLACLFHKGLNFKRFIGISAAVLVIIAFFALQRDLGSAFIFLMVYLIMIAVNDPKIYYTFFSALAAAGAGLVSIMQFSHIKSRFVAWANPWKYVSGKSYQITQSLFAIATGGLFGTGLFLGDPKFVPAIHTDFIFSAICEETGVLTALFILTVYILITIIGMNICMKCKDRINLLAALGLTSLTAVQTLIIVCGVLNIIPITGVTLPFISYGGSSLLSQFINIGLLYFIQEKEKGEDSEQ